MSTDSGIPDFRGPQGVWTKDPSAQAMFTLQNYLADPEVRRRAWRSRRDHPAWGARPNAGHEAISSFWAGGRGRAVITQNIDGLHQAAGLPTEAVVEIHGTLREAECLDCGRRVPMAAALARVDAGEPDPPCLVCGGVQKSATISFGQALVREVLDAAVGAARDCDLMVTAGTSLQVHPAASLCDVAQGSGARLVVLNAEPTPYDPQADAVLREPLSNLLPALLAPTA
ncbi:MAG: NAD-dependent deacetylase [Nocardioidaceae bacterium]|nr:NAD-dependent deacetylase [Nocardioidaceae bacterium]